MPEASKRWVASNEFQQPEQGRITRRSFVGGLAAGFAAMMADRISYARGGLLGINKDRHGTNKFLREFPAAEEIPGIEKVTLKLVKDARKSLIIFRQLHWIPELAKPDRNDDLKEVVDCQADIYHAIKFLQKHEHTKMERLFVEGIADGQQAIQIPHEELRKRGDDRWNRILAEYGSEKVLQDETDLILTGAEDLHLYARILRMVDEKGFEYAKKNGAFDPREDMFLKIVSQYKWRENYGIWGADHNFENNVDRWNFQYPDYAYSLCVLTPKTVATMPLRRKSPPIPADLKDVTWY